MYVDTDRMVGDYTRTWTEKRDADHSLTETEIVVAATIDVSCNKLVTENY